MSYKDLFAHCNYVFKTEEEEILELLTQPQKGNDLLCDRCGKTILVDDILEYQEAFQIEFTAGYSSVFGDGALVSCTLCQSCLYDLIQDFYQTNS